MQPFPEAFSLADEEFVLADHASARSGLVSAEFGNRQRRRPDPARAVRRMGLADRGQPSGVRAALHVIFDR